MNSLFFLFIGIPAIEIFLLIEIGGEIGALNTVLLIFTTAIVGIYFAKQQGIKTIRSGVVNLYQNKIPTYDIFSGASIAFAAVLLIVPGFFTDIIGFFLLMPLTRKIIINFLIKKNKIHLRKKKNDILDGEIIEDKKNEL
tara:strand:- start:1323 stop:1742 length:420 start_codon:yes stop_codon:yes gene_type:complete